MADNKKGFMLYADQKELFKQLPDELAGKLIKHVFSYVNDESPETQDMMLNIAFTPIKLQLKRDLKKYENICNRNRINGSLGGRPKKPKKPSGLSGNPEKPKKPDKDKDKDNDIYNKDNFLKNWNEMRSSYLNTPSNLNRLTEEEDDLFHVAKFSKEDWHLGLKGLFKQEIMPQEIMRFKPKHFLRNTDQYIDAEKNKKYNLYAN